MIILSKCLSVFFSATLAFVAVIASSGNASADQRFEPYPPNMERHPPANPGSKMKQPRDPGRYVMHHGPPRAIPPGRSHRYHNVIVVRPHGPLYPGYGHYSRDSDAYQWLAFTAITLKILDNMNEAQQRAHEAAQVEASVAPIGEKIIWNEGNASGAVTAVRDGTSTSGRYCREFQHEVTIGGKTEKAYGTACRQPDGSWEVISTGAP